MRKGIVKRGERRNDDSDTPISITLAMDDGRKKSKLVLYPNELLSLMPSCVPSS